MFFIDDDEPEVFQRREDGAAGADDDARAARLNLVPLVVPLAFREPAVQDCDHVFGFREAAFETLDRLRRERDLRDEHDGGLATRRART